MKNLEHFRVLWLILFILVNTPIHASISSTEAGINQASALRIIANIGHKAPITEAIISQDKQLLITGSWDNNIKIWALNTGKLIHTLRGHDAAISSLAISTDGLMLISSSLWCGIRTWDIKSGKVKAILREEMFQPGGGCSADAVSFSTNAQYGLAMTSGFSDGNSNDLEIYNISDGTLIRTINTQQDWAIASAMTQDKKIALAFINDDWRNSQTIITIVNPENNKTHSTIKVSGDVSSASFFGDNFSQLITRTDEETALWEVSTGAKTLSIKGKTIQSQSLEKGLLATWDANPTSDADQTVTVWDVKTKSLHSNLTGFNIEVNDLAIRDKGHMLVVANSAGSVVFWDITNGRLESVIQAHKKPVRAVAFQPNQQMLLTAADDNHINVWDIEKAKSTKQTKYDTFSDDVSSTPIIATNAQANLLAEIQYEEIRIKNLTTLKRIKSFETEFPGVVAFNPSGTLLMAGERHGIKIWDVKTGSLLHDISSGNADYDDLNINFQTHAIQFSPDGQQFATGSGLSVFLWDTKTGKLISELGSHASWVTSVQFSPDSQFVISGSLDQSIHYWDIEKSVKARTLSGHQGTINRIKLNKHYVFSGSTDGTVKIWHPTDGSLLATLIMNAQQDWLIITPEGFFNASDKGIDLLHVVNGMETLPVSRIYDVFYRPDIVKAKLAGKPIHDLVDGITLAKALQFPPPKVHVTLSKNEGTAKTLSLQYEVSSDGGGIGEISAYQNGKLVYTDGHFKTSPDNASYVSPNANQKAIKQAVEDRYNKPTRGVRIQSKGLDIQAKGLVRSSNKKQCDPCQGKININTLLGERNQIILIAKNNSGTIASLPAEITYVSTLPKGKPNLWLLAIGINQYQNVQNLNNAKKDAEDFAQAYSEKVSTLFPKSRINVTTLFDEQATKKNILLQLQKIKEQAKPSDSFIWFVASHGMMDGNSLYGIVPTDLKCLDDQCSRIENMLNSNELLEASRQISAMHQLLVLDTCHAGGLNDQLSGLYDARMSVLAKNMGLHLFASAAATEKALDGNPGTNGVFTASLLSSLNNKAKDDNGDQRIGIIELGKYTKQETGRSLKHQYGARVQTPKFMHFGQDMPVYKIKN